jgi:hypothetical protein
MFTLVNSNIMDGDYVGMMQASGGGGFRSKTLHVLGAGMRAEQKKFDGYKAIKTALPSPVNHTHASSSDLVQEFVLPEIPWKIPRLFHGPAALRICRRHEAVHHQAFRAKALSNAWR